MKTTERSHPVFLPYQQAWIADNSRIKLMEKSRQVGMSWATAYGLVRSQCLEGARSDAWVSSRDDAQARLFLEDCRTFAKALDPLSHCQMSVISKDAKPTAYTLTFGSERRIHSLSSNPDAQAGKRGTRVLDEFALHEDPRQLYAIASPGVTWGGQMMILSTHRGADNFFAQLIQEARYGGNPKGISLHRVTLQDALDQGFLTYLKRKLPQEDPIQGMDDGAYFDFVRSTCADPEIFLQEYMCEPLDDRSSFLPYDLILGCEYAAEEPWELTFADRRNAHAQYVLGVDIGRDHDATVFWLLEVLPLGMLATRHVTRLKDTPFSEQAAVLASYMELPGLRRVCMDQTGIGRQLTEEAIRLYGTYRVEGVTFTAGVKEDLAYRLRSSFEAKTLRSPSSPELRADLRSVRRELTSSGNLRFSAERTAYGHADDFWALALALHAGTSTKVQPMAYERIQRASARRPSFGVCV
jgi:phage FluMu gp28-like protein